MRAFAAMAMHIAGGVRPTSGIFKKVLLDLRLRVSGGVIQGMSKMVMLMELLSSRKPGLLAKPATPVRHLCVWG